MRMDEDDTGETSPATMDAVAALSALKGAGVVIEPTPRPRQPRPRLFQLDIPRHSAADEYVTPPSSPLRRKPCVGMACKASMRPAQTMYVDVKGNALSRGGVLPTLPRARQLATRMFSRRGPVSKKEHLESYEYNLVMRRHAGNKMPPDVKLQVDLPEGAVGGRVIFWRLSLCGETFTAVQSGVYRLERDPEGGGFVAAIDPDLFSAKRWGSVIKRGVRMYIPMFRVEFDNEACVLFNGTPYHPEITPTPKEKRHRDPVKESYTPERIAKLIRKVEPMFSFVNKMPARAGVEAGP